MKSEIIVIKQTTLCIKKSKLDLFLNQSLFKLQSNLINKEKALAQIIQEKDQTIHEQQKIIRKLLQRQKSDIDAEVNRSYPWISSSPTANTNTPDSSTSTIYTLTDNGKLTLPWTGSNFTYFGWGGAHCTPPC